LYAIAHLHTVFVTALYWSLLYPVANKAELNVVDIGKHSVPFLFLFVEFFLNNVVVEFRHWVPVLGGYLMLYLAVIVGYTTTGDRWVYTPLKLDTQASWNLLFGVVIAEVGFWFLYAWLNQVKFSTLDLTKPGPSSKGQVKLAKLADAGVTLIIL